MKTKIDAGIFHGDEMKYRALFDNAPVGISLVDKDRNILEGNNALRKIIQVSEKELDKSLYVTRRYVRADGTEMPPEEFASSIAIATGRTVNDVEIGIEIGGKVISWIQVSATPLDLGVPCALVITQDITEKKNTQNKLIDSENRYRAFFENSQDAILITSMDGSVHEANSSACKLLGWDHNEIVKIKRNQIVEDTPQLMNAIGQRSEAGKFMGELIFLRKDNSRIPVEVSSTFFTDSDGKELIISIARDISERKKTEKALSDSEEHLRLASKAAGFGTYSYEFESGKAYYSDEFLALYGLRPGENLELDPDLVARAIFPDDKKKFLAAMEKSNNPSGNGILDIEYRIINKNGQVRWLKARGLTVFNVNTPVGVPLHANGIVQDITARKEDEVELNKLSERCRLITEYSGLGIGYYDIEGNILMFNEEALKNMGGKASDYIGKNVVEVFGPDAGKVYKERFRVAAVSDNPLHFEDNVDLGGKPGWYLSTFTRILNANGVIDGIQVIAENISKRKLAELELRKNEEQLNLMFSTMSEGVALNEAIYNDYGDMIDYRIIQVNDAFYRMADYKKNINVVGNTAIEAYGLSGSLITDWWKDHKSRNETVFTEFLSPLSNKWYMISTSPIKADKFVTTFTDITERKKTEEKLRTASLYSRTLLEASLDPLVTINHDGKITDVNHATEKITGIKRNKLIGSEFADYFVETEKAREGYNIVFSKGAVKDFPLTIRHKNGRTADILYNATLFKNEAGEVQGVFAAARDITVRKKMEVKLRNSQKLLQNLNQHLHEVRENERSQIAMNLHDDLGQRLTALYLDVSWIKGRIGVQSAKVRTRLDEMSLEINEAIDGIKELSSFLRPTILYDLGLVPAIISQLNKFESQSGIKCYFYFDSEEFNVSEKISLIFYRTIQESLTNIARHSGASAMELSLKKLKNAIEVIIRDDGVGIEESKINSMQSMGLEGIRERVESAHGEVSIKGEKGSGTTITVTIPTDKSNL